MAHLKHRFASHDFFSLRRDELNLRHGSFLLRRGSVFPRDGSYFPGIVSGLAVLAATILLILPLGSAFSYQPQSAASDQRYPAAAFDGTNYLIVWQDYRNGNWDVYGARVTPAGTVLDPQGIAISTATGDQIFPGLAFDGTNYLVVWGDSRSGSSHIFGTRVTKAGLVLEPAGIAVSSAQYDQRYPAVSFNGTDFLVVWEYDLNTGYSDIYGARVTTGGLVLDTGVGIVISTELYNQGWPAVATAGTSSLVIWDDSRSGTSTDIYGTIVSNGGVVLQPSGIPISTSPGDETHPVLAVAGSEFFVVWDYSIPSGVDIYGARVTSGGTVLDPSGIAISTSIFDQRYPGVACSGSNYLVAWEDTRAGVFPDIYCARLSIAGTLLDASGIPISTGNQTEDWCAVAYSGASYLVAWEDTRYGPYDIFAARVNTGGTVLDPDGFTNLLFASASAVGGTGSVALTWHTTVEIPASSFVIERSDSYDGEYVGLDLPVSEISGLTFSCTDLSVAPNRSYWYKIMLYGPSGEESYGPIEARAAEVPAAYKVYAPFPNPFNPACTIRYEIPESGQVMLTVFDVRGTVVRTLVNGWRTPGAYDQVWDGRGDDGKLLPSGVYLYKLEANRFSVTDKIVLLK